MTTLFLIVALWMAASLLAAFAFVDRREHVNGQLCNIRETLALLNSQDKAVADTLTCHSDALVAIDAAVARQSEITTAAINVTVAAQCLRIGLEGDGVSERDLHMLDIAIDDFQRTVRVQ